MNENDEQKIKEDVHYRLNKLEEDMKLFSLNNLKKKLNKQEEKIMSLNNKIKLLEDSKSHIFSVLALFFGIFTFIAIDIGVTKSLLTFFNAESICILILALVGIIILQGLFCTFIYCFMIKPFLTKSCTEHKKCNTLIITTIIIILLLFVGIAIYCCYYFNNKYSYLQTQINTIKQENNKLKSEISTLKKHL